MFPSSYFSNKHIARKPWARICLELSMVRFLKRKGRLRVVADMVAVVKYFRGRMADLPKLESGRRL